MNAIRICDKWQECPLLWCDPYHEMCKATGKQCRKIKTMFENAKRNLPILLAMKERQIATAALGMKKYDRRRKNARGYWRNSAVRDTLTIPAQAVNNSQDERSVR